MLFPGSRIWYEGAVADLASLTEEIKSSGFTGHIVLEFQDSIDVVICVGGEFLRVIEKIGRRILTTKKYREIWGKCQIKQGRMTVFELAPRLVRRLRAVGARRLYRSGTAAGCDPAQMLDELGRRGFSGILDCIGPDGKLLLDMTGGRVEACYYTANAGLSHDGIAAFTTWHRSFVRSTRPWFFFISEAGESGSEQIWDQILMDAADQTPLPLASSIERLYGTYGREAAPGETLVSAGERPGRAFYLMTGAVELFPAQVSGWVGGAPLSPGEFLGLGWMLAGTVSPVTARASIPTRFLALDAAALDVVVANSPVLAGRMIREAAATLASLRARLAAFQAEPRLRDAESAVVQALERHPQGGRDGVPAAELFRELTQILPLPLQEIDALFRRLAALAGVAQIFVRVKLFTRQFCLYIV
jgi:CRP-like cAMP-binding protein